MPAVKLTRDQLIAFEPCDMDERLKLFGPRRKSLTAKQAFAAGATIRDLLWVAGKLGLKDQSIRFALACAQRVAHLDKTGSAQACIDATTACRDERTEMKREAMLKARRAAYAADAAAYAYAAAAAAYAADAAADAAAYAAYARQKEVKVQQALFLEIFG